MSNSKQEISDNGETGVFGLETYKVDLFGEEMIIDPNEGIIGENWSIVPDLPKGVRQFSENLSIDGETLDSFGPRTCAITANAGSLCWEFGANGVDSGTIKQKYSNEVDSKQYFSSISVGGNHTCALQRGGISSNILCWGSNWNGQLGKQSNLDSYGESIIESINGGNWTAISSGKIHSCAIELDSEIYCWGGGSLGQIGDGENTDKFSPSKVILGGFGEIQQIDSGGYHTCVLSDSSEIYCWGWNGHGQLGDGTYQNRNAPTKVLFSESYEFQSISIGEWHSCALAITGEVLCWGGNMDGQIDDSENAALLRPEMIFSQFSEVQFVYAGSSHTCVSTLEGDHDCNGDIGLGEQVPGFSIANFSSGEGYNCFLSNNGGIWCNGAMDFSNAGVPLEISSTTVPITIPSGRIAGTPEHEHNYTHEIYIDNASNFSDTLAIIVKFGEDLDGDGWSDESEKSCGSNHSDRGESPEDTDGDGVCNFLDLDDDQDGHADIKDVFPLDPEEWQDKDNDGLGSNEDRIEVSGAQKGASYTIVILSTMLILEIRKLTIEF